MLKAVLDRGAIRLLEPLPPDWQEGQELQIEKLDEPEPTPEQIRADFALLEQLCAQNTPEDEAALEAALEVEDRLAKEHMRRAMGLE